MKINIYYGGRGIIDDPSLFVIAKMTDVLKELNVKTEQFNLYEQKNEITALVNTLKDADGVILASTVEWFGVGGYLMQFLDACWLYGDKEKIAGTYMMPVVMSTTYGERDGMMNLSTAWEILGGQPCDGICGYIADTSALESGNDYSKVIEKKAENLYRTINQKTPGFPASNQAVKKMISITKSVDLTPQESEQLSRYASDDRFVQKQKEDIQELASLFKTKMSKSTPKDSLKDYAERIQRSFSPQTGFDGTYEIILSDSSDNDVIFIDVAFGKCLTSIKKKDNEESKAVVITMEKGNLEEILAGRMTFQRAFMTGSLKLKGDFKLLRGMDQIFPFMSSDNLTKNN